MLRERRSLVILDNAADEAQLRPLWPGLGAGLVLVTSRRALTGLDGVLRLVLQPLSPDESMRLLRTITGSAFHRAAPEVTAQVGRLCGHLPLALRIAANRLASRPGWTMAHLADRLSDPNRRLAALTAGDLAVEAAFSLSYAQLSGPARQVFRRLSLMPGADFGGELAAVAAQVAPVEAEDHLDELVDLNLLQPAPQPDCFRFHDLIRLFAITHLQADEPPVERQATHDRIMLCLLETATVAGRWFEPGYGAPPPDWRGLVTLDSSERAQAWLQVNRDNWVGALANAAAAGDHARVVEVAEAMHWYSGRDIVEGRWTEIFQMSRASASQLDDPRQEITHLNYLSWAVSTCDRRHQESVDLAMTAYRLATELGDRRLQGWALQYVATGCFWIEDGIGRAEAALREAAQHFDAVDDHDGYVQAIIGIAHALRDSAQPETALPQYEATLKALQERPVSPIVSFTAAYAHHSMARTLVLLGRHAEAVVQAGIALPLIEAFGEPVLLSSCLRLLGTAEADIGAVEDARVHLQRALDIFISTDQTEHVAPTRAALAALSSP
ncbi:AfsR family transcriptional regulator [Micromonospora sp. NPDC005215]|uniref:AfsR family transcriptional regulator n=1 Tax=Micromonospora sp. NPDC005215 TaxID=3157024 RepID=UPI0033BE32DE